MSDNTLPPIKGRLELDDSSVNDVLGRVGKQAEAWSASTKKASDSVKLSAWGAGEAMGDLARSYGVNGQMARKLEDVTENLAMKLGAGALIFGAVGIAATAAWNIYGKLKDAQEKLTAETIKGGQAAGVWIEGQLKDKAATEELIAAKRELAKVEFDANKLRIEMAIPAIKELLAEKVARQNELLTTSKAYDNLWEGTGSRTKKMAEDIGNEIKKLSADLRVLHAQQGLYTDGNRQGLGANSNASGSGLDDWVFEFKRRQTLEEQYTAESAVLTQARIDDANREADARRVAFYNIAGFMSSSFQAMYQAGGKHARKSLSLFKMAGSAEAMINADRAAASSYAWGTQLGGPALGATLAAIAYAAGLARVKAIRNMSLEGGGGAGGSSASYSVSPTTGETNGGYKYFNYEQSTYGSGWRPGSAGGGTTIIYAMDSKDVMDVLMENPKAVAKSYALSQKGYA